jgi:hypothetical protein
MESALLTCNRRAGAANRQQTSEIGFVQPCGVESRKSAASGSPADLDRKGRAVGDQRIAPEHEMVWEFDSIVLVTQRIANDGLYRELESDPDLLVSAGISAYSASSAKRLASLRQCPRRARGHRPGLTRPLIDAITT